jgi:hypothetical protein
MVAPTCAVLGFYEMHDRKEVRSSISKYDESCARMTLVY